MGNYCSPSQKEKGVEIIITKMYMERGGKDGGLKMRKWED